VYVQDDNITFGIRAARPGYEVVFVKVHVARLMVVVRAASIHPSAGGLVFGELRVADASRKPAGLTEVVGVVESVIIC
jgi:hypothetical protein